MPPKGTFRSAFSDTDHSRQVAAGESGICTCGLRITRPKHPMFTALISNSQVRLSATTNTQGLPLHRLSILPSQRPSRHIPYRYLSTSEVSHDDAHDRTI